MDNLCEVWMPVPNYESFYQVSSHGRFARVVKDGRILRKINYATPYPSVSVKDIDGTGQKCFYMHSLVALVFIGPRPDFAVIRHLDGNKYNNTVTNLSYGTKEQNYEDTRKHKVHAGENNSRALLNERAVRAIKILNKDFNLDKYDLSKAFDVNQATVHAILTGRNWKDVV